MNQPKRQERLKINLDFDEPKRYDVIFMNDDVTTMEFVVYVLENVFYKTKEEAQILMFKVHVEGSAVVGTYNFDIALTKQDKTINMARAQNFPLEVIVKETIE
jgi:ATP-dependent Clp protease adaptor protein ClpS